MEHREVEPPEELRDVIKCFWYTSIHFENFPSGFRIMPDGYAEIIFHFGSACNISTAQGDVQLLPSPFLMGLLGQPAILHAQNQFEVMGIRCFPWTVFDLLGLPSGKDGVRTFEHPIAALQAILAPYIQAGQVNEALNQVKQYFLNVELPVTRNNVLTKAGVAMRKANGTLPVSHVAEAAHATVRTLERKFKSSSGYSVKDVSGLMRFERVRDHLWTNPSANLASLAHELGYTDQAHLSREFKRYTGSSPAAFTRKSKQARQVAGHDFVAFIQA